MKLRADATERTNPSLLVRIRNWGDEASWEAFYDAYWKLIYGAALKSGLLPEEAEEATQDTFLTVAKKMDEFRYDPALGSFRGWLGEVMRKRFKDQFRKRGAPNRQAVRLNREGTRTATIERIPDDRVSAPFSEEEWQRNLRDAAIERIKRKGSLRNYQLFELYVLKGWTVEEIVETMGVTEYQVYQARTRVVKAVKKEVEHLQSKMF